MELIEEGQESNVIDLIVANSVRFFEANFYVLQNLLNTLRDEQMFDAVLNIAQDILQMGKERKNVQFMAYANTVIGEILIQEY